MRRGWLWSDLLGQLGEQLLELLRHPDQALGATVGKEEIRDALGELSQKWEEAVRQLRAADMSIYDLPWYLLIGEPQSGKSTTIGSMLNWINHHYRKHILTLEDPIEFVFTEDKCLINQREIGMDVVNFGIGMKHAVREDPDVSRHSGSSPRSISSSRSV